ncbi:DegT/DnrJ/EryC1/StrS family aminotransferase [Candidatus Peregrinibacteria bacterium]|nr:DegT/DnrJ/EryC1/StrS family aminotransferase [Candidatus Peregrinibacteria bacterium]
MIPFVDLKTQYQSLKPEIDAAIQKVIDDCAFVHGKYCEEFENNFARACEKAICIGTSNGTTALELALRAYSIGPGDEVIVPSHTFIATAEVVSILGATPVFAEIDESTYTIDPKDIEKRITPKTKAIIPVHLYGQAADMDSILEIAQKHNLKVIEDCAQAHLAKYKGKTVPVGEIGCFSFFPGKNLGAYGDAGAVVTDNPELAKKISQFLNHGREKGEKYKHTSIGNNYRMDGLQGAILNVKLKYLQKWTDHRRAAAQKYRDGLSAPTSTNTALPQGGSVPSSAAAPTFAANSEANPLLLPFEADYAYHVYHLFVLRSPRRDEIIKKLRENQIECGIHYPIPLHLQPAYANLGYKEGDFPVTEKIVKEIFSLPICGEVTDESIEKVISAISI